MQLKSNNSGLILINRTTLFTFFAKAIKFSTNHILLLKLMSSCFLVPFIGMSQRYIATVTGRGYKWVGCVIGPGIPSASLNSSNCQPCSFMDVDRFISKSFMLIDAESIPNNSVPIPSSLLFSDKTRFMGQPSKQKDKS